MPPIYKVKVMIITNTFDYIILETFTDLSRLALEYNIQNTIQGIQTQNIVLGVYEILTSVR